MIKDLNRHPDWRPLSQPLLQGRWITITQPAQSIWRIILVEDDTPYCVAWLPFGSAALAHKYADAFAELYDAQRLDSLWERQK